MGNRLGSLSHVRFLGPPYDRCTGPGSAGLTCLIARSAQRVSTMLRLAFLALLIAAGVLSVADRTVTVAQGAPTCLGEPATVFSDEPGAVLPGTGGRDIIFTDKVQTIYALGGDDLICVDGNRATVYAGSGNDRI